jgi:hypothetical protein
MLFFRAPMAKRPRRAAARAAATPARKKSNQRTTLGRSAGESGERVTPHQISARMPGEPYHLLDAAAHVLREPHWKILTAAIEQYVASLPSDRDEIRRAARSAETRCAKCAARNNE